MVESEDAHLKLSELLSRAAGTVLITSHQQADPDAIGAMSGMKLLVSFLNEDVDVVLALDDLSVISRNIVDHLDLSILSMNSVKFSEISFLILVDSNNLEICPVAARVLEENDQACFVVIDHHERSEIIANRVDAYVVSSTAGSTSEMVSSLLMQFQVQIDEKTAIALTCGILYDSGFLARATSHVFRILAHLSAISSQIYVMARELLNMKMESSEKIARIKAAQRMRRKMLGDLVLLFTHVSSHEASAARGLLSLGGDLVVVVASRKDETRVSIRASSYFLERLNVNLAQDLVPWLLQYFQGSGGGHSKAAGLNLVSGITLEQLMQRIMTYLTQKQSSVEGHGNS